MLKPTSNSVGFFYSRKPRARACGHAEPCLLNLEVLTIYKIIYSAVDETPGVRDNSLKRMVGAKGFEPSTSWSRTRRASQAALRPDRLRQKQKQPIKFFNDSISRAFPATVPEEGNTFFRGVLFSFFSYALSLRLYLRQDTASPRILFSRCRFVLRLSVRCHLNSCRWSGQSALPETGCARAAS